MNELALFAGAGGGILGGQLLGWKTVCAVEVDAFCARRLMQRQNEKHLPPFPIWDDVCTFDGYPWRGIVDVVSGGFPCQDISVAGPGTGLEGERSGLWVEMARIINEVRPPFVFVENSPMLTSRGLGIVLGDLASMGYDAEWGVLAASDVGPLTNGKESGLWPTPTVCGNYNRKGASKNSGDGLATAVKKWPTPTAMDAAGFCGKPDKGRKGPNSGRTLTGKALEMEGRGPHAITWATPTARDYRSGMSKEALTRRQEESNRGVNLSEQMQRVDGNNGKLNPPWVEWLMGWPLGWTGCEPLETDKCHNATLKHGEGF